MTRTGKRSHIREPRPGRIQSFLDEVWRPWGPPAAAALSVRPPLAAQRGQQTTSWTWGSGSISGTGSVGPTSLNKTVHHKNMKLSSLEHDFNGSVSCLFNGKIVNLLLQIFFLGGGEAKYAEGNEYWNYWYIAWGFGKIYLGTKFYYSEKPWYGFCSETDFRTKYRNIFKKVRFF